MIESILLKLSWPTWLFLLCLVPAIALGHYYYGKTLPPVSRNRRIIGQTLRILSLTIIFFLLLEPVLEILRRNNEKPAIAVIFDESASMKISDSRGLRRDSLDILRTEIEALWNQDSASIHTFGFATSVREISSDTLKFVDDGTNLDQALRGVLDSLSGQNLQRIYLISDGVYNQGANPLNTAERSMANIYTVRIGDPVDPGDLAVRRVLHNAITYAGKESPVEVTIWNNGYSGKRTLVTVRQGKKILAQQQVELGKSGFEQKIRLNVITSDPGTFNWSVDIQPLGEEKNVQNNKQNIRVRILQREINVLVMSGTIGFDRHFLSVAGKELEDINFLFRTEKQADTYFEGSFQDLSLDTVDVVVLHGYPTASTTSPRISALFQAIQQRHLPVLWFLNKKTRLDKLQPYAQLLPFQDLSPVIGSGEEVVQLTVGGRLHPALKVNDSESANQLLWKDLPPLETFQPVTPENGAQPLLVATGNNDNKNTNRPLGFAYKRGKNKHLVLNGANFGHWYFLLQEDPVRTDFFSTFLERSVRWLVNRDDIQQIQIEPQKDIYNVGEAIIFSGQIYDNLYARVSDAEATVTVWQDSTRVLSDELLPEGNGNYRLTLPSLGEGDFRFRIDGRQDGKAIGSRRGSFSVKPFFLEFQETAANHQLLREIAQRSAGKSLTVKEFLAETSAETMQSRITFSNSEHFLWSYWQWLLLLVTLLGSEWLLRKRWGML